MPIRKTGNLYNVYTFDRRTGRKKIYAKRVDFDRLNEISVLELPYVEITYEDEVPADSDGKWEISKSRDTENNLYGYTALGGFFEASKHEMVKNVFFHYRHSVNRFRKLTENDEDVVEFLDDSSRNIQEVDEVGEASKRVVKPRGNNKFEYLD